MVEFDPERKRSDRVAVVDLDPQSSTYAQIVGRVSVPGAGDELHHFGWNACRSCLCPNAPHPHVERRYLIVPGLRSSNIHILDTKPDPRNPRVIRTIQAKEVGDRAGYSRPHTVHCGPDGIYVTAIGVHTLAMLVVTGVIAVVVYEWVGLAFLRRGWINLDLLGRWPSSPRA